MTDEIRKRLKTLYNHLAATDREIQNTIATELGIGPIDDLELTERERLKEEEVRSLIEFHEDAVLEGDTVEEWHAFDTKLSPSDISRLMDERTEILEQIIEIERPIDRYDERLTTQPSFGLVLNRLVRTHGGPKRRHSRSLF